MSSASNPHGGQEQTITALYTTMMHWDAIIAAPGYTDQAAFTAGGNPFGTSVTVDQEGNLKEDVEAAVKYQAKRTTNSMVVKTGTKIKSKKAADPNWILPFFLVFEYFLNGGK